MNKLNRTIKHLHENHFTHVALLLLAFMAVVIYKRKTFYEAFGFWLMIGIPCLALLVIVIHAINYWRNLK